MSQIAIDAATPPEDAVAAVRQWVAEHVPAAWRDAAERGGAAAIREVRSRADYEAWYPTFGGSGLVAPTWPVPYGGLDLPVALARRIDAELRPYNLGRLNPLGLNLAAPALFAHGTEEQRLRYLPRIVDNSERWCQLFSEPGAGSDLASLATRAERDGDEWHLTGQKVWTTWAHVSDWGVVLARTDGDVPKRKGITYFLLDLHQPGVEVRPLRHIGGEIDFNEVFLDHARVPDDQRVGEVGEGWKVANATLSGERQMVSGSGSGGVDRIGGSGSHRLVRQATKDGIDPVAVQELMQVHSEELIRDWTNQRVRAGLRAGRSPGPESSIGKVHQGALNQRIQLLATDLLGPAATAWDGDGDQYEDDLPYEVSGMLRSRANTIEGGTTEVNKNILGERVLGLAREPDPYRDAAWREVPTLVSREYEALDVSVRDGVGWLVFDRPDVGNAMDATMLAELEHAWADLDADPAVRVIVNTGNGDAFQTGLDVRQLAKDKEALREQSRRTRDAALKLTAWHCGVRKPVIAAVNGVCAGGGLHFVADADMVIASSAASFVDPHVSIGQVSAYETIGLVRKSPMEAILRMALTGRHERITAERARQLGILSEVVEPDRLRDAAADLAAKVARNSPAAMAATKRALWGALEAGLTDACRAGSSHLVDMWGHPDQTEGPLSFTEKRPANWLPLENP